MSLVSRRVRDLVRRPPVTCEPDLPVRDAARLMDRERIGSLVVAAAGAPTGIVTVRDLRTRVVAAGLGGDTPVSAVMSAPVATVEAGSAAFEAFLLMTRRDIHHLPVVEGGRLTGVLGRDDFAALWLVDPAALTGDIDRAASLEAIEASASRLTGVVRRLVDEGAGPDEVGAIVAELNDRLARRIAGMAQARLEADGHGPPPLPWCLLAAGSEGRREQTLRTDEDSGLVYADPSPDLAASAAAYFGRLSAAIGEGLRRAGVPPCQGGYMAETPRWCQPLRVWRRYVLEWLDEPTPPRLLEASVYFDLRPVAGEETLGEALRAFAYAEAARRPLFLRLLAASAAERRPAVGLFGGIRVPWTGPHRGTVDIKAHGVFPMTQAMRVYALSLGVVETNTLDRLAAVSARGTFTAGEAKDLRAAYLVVLRLQLAHQLARASAGRPADNRITPRRLDRIDRAALGEALRTLAWLQRHLAERFQTALLG